MKVATATVLAVALAMLVGCAPQPAARDDPIDEAPVLVNVDQPAQVFGGDCSAMFTEAALTEALGQPLAVLMWEGPVAPGDLLVEQSGGASCAWGESAVSSPVLFVVALPAAAVTVPEETECVPTELSSTSCPVDVTVNGIRLSGTVTSDLAGADPRARVAAVRSLFTASANAAAPGSVPTPLAGAWHNPADCAEITENVDWVAVLGTDDYTVDEALGTDVYVSAVVQELWGPRSLPGCAMFSATGPPVRFSTLGGGAWARDAVLAQDGATVVSVPGLDFVVETPTFRPTIDIFDGVNWIRAKAEDPEALYSALVAIVAELNAQA